MTMIFNLWILHENFFKIDGIRKIKIQTKLGIKKVINVVYFVPKLTHNLLNVAQLMEIRYTFHMDGDMCVILSKKVNMPPILVP